MLAALYKTKKSLKGSIGEPLHYQETSMFGAEFKRDGELTVVGPSAYDRRWYAVVTMENGLIKKVK